MGRKKEKDEKPFPWTHFTYFFYFSSSFLSECIPFSYVIYFPLDFTAYPILVFFFFYVSLSFEIDSLCCSILQEYHFFSTFSVFHQFWPRQMQSSEEGSVWFFCGHWGCLSMKLFEYMQGCLDPVFKTHIFQHRGISRLCGLHAMTVTRGIKISSMLLRIYVFKDSTHWLTFVAP